MRLSKIAKGIVTAIIVLWIAAMAGMIAIASNNQTDPAFPKAGALEDTVVGIDGQGLNVTAVSLADIYGEEYVAGAVLCEGLKNADIEQSYQVDPAELELPESGIPAGSSYLLLRTAEGEAVFDKVDRANVDLCSVPLEGYFNTYSLLPLAKVGESSWGLAG